MRVSRGLVPEQLRCPYHGAGTMKIATIDAPQFIVSGMRVKRKIYRCNRNGCPVVAAGPQEVYKSVRESEMSGEAW